MSREDRQQDRPPAPAASGPAANAPAASAKKSSAEVARDLDKMGMAIQSEESAKRDTPPPPDPADESMLDDLEDTLVMAPASRRAAALAHVSALAAKHRSRGGIGRIAGPGIARTLAVIGAGLLLGSAAALALSPAVEAGPVPRVDPVSAAAPTASAPPTTAATPIPGVTGTTTARTTFVKQSGPCRLASAFSDQFRFEALNGALTLTQLSNGHVTRGTISPNGEFTTSAAGQGYSGRIQGTVLEGRHTYTADGCNEVYGITGQLVAPLVGTTGVVALPSVGPITAVVAPPNTSYSVQVSNPGEMPLTFTWSNTTTCGGFLGNGPRALWEHPHPPCTEQPVHPGTIQVRIAGPGYACTVTYAGGSGSGTGQPPTTCGGSAGLPLFTPIPPSPRGSLLPGVGGVVTTGGGSGGFPGFPGGGILLGGGLLIFGVGVSLRSRCDCGKHEQDVRNKELEIADKEQQADEIAAWIEDAWDALIEWWHYEIDLRAWIRGYWAWTHDMRASIESWERYVAFLRSLLGPLAVAGRDKLDTRPHPGWIQVGPALWGNSEDAAHAARMSVVIGELLAGGLMQTAAGGLTYVSALALAETALAAARRAELDMSVEWSKAADELAKAVTTAPKIEEKIAQKMIDLEDREKNLEVERAMLERFLQALEDCQRAIAPNCPPGSAVVNVMDLIRDDNPAPRPEGQVPPAPPAPPAPPPPPGGTQVKKDERAERPAAEAPTPPAAPAPAAPAAPRGVLVTREQQAEIRRKRQAREGTRSEIRKLESKPSPTTAERARLSELRATERDQDIEIHNSIVRAHNQNVDRIEADERRRTEERREEGRRLDSTDAKRIDTLETRRSALRDDLLKLEDQARSSTSTGEHKKAIESKRIELVKLDQEIADAKSDAMKRSTITDPDAKPAPTQTKEREVAPDPWETPKNRAPVVTQTPPEPPALLPDDESRIMHQEHRVEEIERELVTLARKSREGTITEAELRRQPELRQQYRAELRSLTQDTTESVERARVAPRPAPVPPTRTRTRDSKGYDRVRGQTPDPVTGVRPDALRAAGRTRERLEALERERELHARRLPELDGKPTRTPAEEAERKHRVQRLYTQIPAEQQRLIRDLVTRYPELTQRPRPDRGARQTGARPVDQWTVARLAEIDTDIARLGDELRALLDQPEGSSVSDEAAAKSDSLRLRREREIAASDAREARTTELRTAIAALRREREALLERDGTTPPPDPEATAALVTLVSERAANTTRFAALVARAERTIEEQNELERLIARNGMLDAQLALLTNVRQVTDPSVTEALLKVLATALGAELEVIAKDIRARVVVWTKDRLGVDDPQHPLVSLLTSVGVSLGEGELDALLARLTATSAREAFALTLLDLGDRLDPEKAQPLLQNAYVLTGAIARDGTWGAIGDHRALRVRLSERIGTLAVASSDLDRMAPALENLHTLGLGDSPLAGSLTKRIREVFGTVFDTTTALDAFDTDPRSLPEKAAGLASLELQLRSILDMTGDENVRLALEQIHLRALTVASRLDGLLTSALRDVEAAGLEEEAAKRLFEKVRDEKLTGAWFTLWSYTGATAEEQRIFDEVAPSWRTWLRVDDSRPLSAGSRLVWEGLSGMLLMERQYTRGPEQAAGMLTGPLRARWTERGRMTRAAAARAAELQQLQLALRTGDRTTEERLAAFTSAFRTARAEADRFDESLRSARTAAGDHLGRLTALREQASGLQAIALGGRTEEILEELRQISLKLNGWDEDRARPGHLLTERIRHKGLYERAQELDPDRKALTSAAADDSAAFTEARLVRDRIAHLQQRRVDLMLLDPARFSYGSLMRELQQDALIWKGRKPWDELAWLSRDVTSARVHEETEGALLFDLPVLAWQMASAQDDPQSFAGFLTRLQEAKAQRGEAVFRAYMDTPWYRRGWGNQTRRILNASETFQRMYATDETLLYAVRAMARTAISDLRRDHVETLRRNGFVEMRDGQDRYVVPTRFRFDPISVGEREAVRDWTDELFNVSTVAQIVTTYVVGGFAGHLGRFWSIQRNAHLAVTLGSQIAIEATAFLALEGVIHGGNVFRYIAGNGSFASLGKDWLHTALILGGLHGLVGPLMHAFEAAGVSGVRAFLAGASVAGRAAETVGFLERGLHSTLRLGAEAAWLVSVGRLFGEKLTVEALTRAVFTIGVMRANGVITDVHAAEALTQARRLVELRNGTLDHFAGRARDVFESVARDGARRELNDHERAQLTALRESARQGSGGLDLAADLARIEAALARDQKVAIGETRGGWRDLATDRSRQVERYGAPLVEALDAAGSGGRTFNDPDPATRAFKEQHWTKFKAMVGFMYEAGRWVSVKQEMHGKYRTTADALFRARQAWSDFIRTNFNATVIGTVKDMRNDCDFNFSLGKKEGDFDPVPRMRDAREWTRERVREALEELGYTKEQIQAADHELLLETNSYTDPAILHMYTRLPPELRGNVIASLTRNSVGVVRYMFEHRVHELTPELRTTILSGMRDLAAIRTPEQIARDLGARRDWTTAEGRNELLGLQSARFKDYLQLRDRIAQGTATAAEQARFATALKEISEIQMLINVFAEGAYPIPAAGLVTVSIKEAVLASQNVMQALKTEMKDLKREIASIQKELEGLYERRLATEPGATLQERLSAARARDAQFDAPARALFERLATTQRTLRSRERAYEGLRQETIKDLTPDEALQSVLGDLIFFWHMAEAASKSLDPYDVVMRYEVSKYAARLLEVAEVFGMPASSGITHLLRVATRIYKTKEPWTALYFERPVEARAAMQAYFSALQRATAEVVEFLVPRTSLVKPPPAEARVRSSPLQPVVADDAVGAEARTAAVEPSSSRRMEPEFESEVEVMLEGSSPPGPSSAPRRIVGDDAVGAEARTGAIEPSSGTRAEPDADSEVTLNESGTPSERGTFGRLGAPPEPLTEIIEWQEGPSRGEGARTREAIRAQQDELNLFLAEGYLDEAVAGAVPKGVDPRTYVEELYRQYGEAIGSLRRARDNDGPNFWEHFGAEEAAAIKARLDHWERTGDPLPKLDEIVAMVERAVAERASRPAPGPEVRTGGSSDPGLDRIMPSGWRVGPAGELIDADAGTRDSAPGASGSGEARPSRAEPLPSAPRGPGLAGEMDLMALTVAEKVLNDAVAGKLGTPQGGLLPAIEHFHAKFMEALARVRTAVERQGERYWDGLPADDVAHLQELLRRWSETGAAMPSPAALHERAVAGR